MAGIPKSILIFLEELKENNNREWFETQKDRFKKEEAIYKSFGEIVLEGLETSDQIEKMKVYRIYRDVRFSKDKTPYKVNRSLTYIREGEARRGSYFLKIESGKSFVGGGFFGPNGADLLRIRKEFEMDDSEIRDIINNKEFSKVYGNKFVPYNQLKTAPKGFDKMHPAIDLIKNKAFFFQHFYTDKEVLAPDFSDKVITHLKLLRPYLDLMSDILTTNLNGESLLG